MDAFHDLVDVVEGVAVGFGLVGAAGMLLSLFDSYFSPLGDLGAFTASVALVLVLVLDPIRRATKHDHA